MKGYIKEKKKNADYRKLKKLLGENSMDSFWALRLNFMTLCHINRAFSRARKLRNVNSLARPSSCTERISTSTG